MSTDGKDDGGPAFPAPDLGDQDFGQRGAYPGMTLRDFFAAKAMQAYLSAYPCAAYLDDGPNPEAIAGDAYDMADAMLKAQKA